jgi:hypothetical protein
MVTDAASALGETAHAAAKRVANIKCFIIDDKVDRTLTVALECTATPSV